MLRRQQVLRPWQPIHLSTSPHEDNARNSRRYLFFFFYSYGNPRDLHSFPTRRSSDLRGPYRTRLGICRRPFGNEPRERRRSEEHTSELQSHSELVCRLLLEKKKSGSTTTVPSIHQRPNSPSCNGEI